MHAFTPPDSISPLPRALPPAELSALRAGRRRDHHQLREPALRDREVPGRRPAQAQADLRGGRPRPVQAGRRRCGSGSGRGLIRRDEAIRALRVVAVAVQELRRAAAGLGAGPRPSSGTPAGDRRPPAATRSTPLSCTRSPRSSASRRTWCSSAASRSRRPSASTRRPTSSCTRRSTRPSACRSSRRWRAAARSSRRTPAPCRRPRAAPPCCPIPTTRHRSPGPSSRPRARRGTACATTGSRRAGQFTWGATAAATLDVYREVAERRTPPPEMKILVTGGAGFIGSHTCDRLLALGHEVVVLDALTPPVHRDGRPRT